MPCEKERWLYCPQSRSTASNPGPTDSGTPQLFIPGPKLVIWWRQGESFDSSPGGGNYQAHSLCKARAKGEQLIYLKKQPVAMPGNLMVPITGRQVWWFNAWSKMVLKKNKLNKINGSFKKKNLSKICASQTQPPMKNKPFYKMNKLEAIIWKFRQQKLI